jgi:hypothetical protein
MIDNRVRKLKSVDCSRKETDMSVGQAYSDVLTPRAQETLEMGCNWIIDHCFENYND